MDLQHGIEGALSAIGCTDLGWDAGAGGIGSGWLRRDGGAAVRVQAWADLNPVPGAAPGVFVRFAYTVDVADPVEPAPIRGLPVHPAWDESAALAQLERALRAAVTRGGEAMAS